MAESQSTAARAGGQGQGLQGNELDPSSSSSSAHIHVVDLDTMKSSSVAYRACMSDCQTWSLDGWKYTLAFGITGGMISNFYVPPNQSLLRYAPFALAVTAGIALDWKTCADKCARQVLHTPSSASSTSMTPTGQPTQQQTHQAARLTQ